MSTLPIAFFNLNPIELIVVLVLGVLLFGRRLPEVGKSLGRTIVEFKKGLNSTTEEINKAAREDDDVSPAATTPRQIEARPAQRSSARQVKQIAGTSEEP